MSVVAAMMGERPFTLAEMICSLGVLILMISVAMSLKHRVVELFMGGKVVKIERAKEPGAYWFYVAFHVALVGLLLVLLL